MLRDAPASVAPTSTPGTAAPERARIRGVDVARALAIVGMVAVHIGPTDEPGLAGSLYAVPHGRASILFVLVAGVGVSLLARSRSRSTQQVRLTLAWRALLLLPLGLALQELDHGVRVILQDYAVLFVVALLVLRLSDRWLLALAATSATLGPAGFLWGRAVSPDVFDRSSTAITDPPGEIVHGLILSGAYPLITWLAPFLFGMWLGRQDLRSPRLRTRLALGGLATALAVVAVAHLLVATFGRPSSSGDLRHLATTVPHGQMPLWLMGGTGAAAFVLGGALIVADRVPWASRPFAAAGGLALTIYVGHLLALHADRPSLTSGELAEAAPLLVVWAVVILTVAKVWRTVFARGPLELVLHPPGLASIGASAPKHLARSGSAPSHGSPLHGSEPRDTSPAHLWQAATDDSHGVAGNGRRPAARHLVTGPVRDAGPRSRPPGEHRGPR